MDTGAIIGVDIGGTNVRIGAKHEKEECLESFYKTNRERVLFGREPVKVFLQFVKWYMKDALHSEKVAGIAIGLPATVSKDRRTVIQTPNIRNMDHIHMADILERELGIPAYLERDVDLLLKWDIHENHIPTEGIVAGIYVGTGIGNAIYIDGRPLSGKNGVAGELGHIPVIGNRLRCGCGNLGCSECVASGGRLLELKNRYYAGDDFDSLFEEFERKPKLVEFVDDVACVIAAEVNILDPDYLVLGGGVIDMKHFPKDYLLDRIYLHARKPYPADNLSVIFSGGSDDKGVNGAICYAQDEEALLSRMRRH